MTQPKFLLGMIVATDSALEALEEAGQDAMELLHRHQSGDWGDLCEEDRQESELSVLDKSRILSAYTLKTGKTIWILTEGDRRVTAILLPDDAEEEP